MIISRTRDDSRDTTMTALEELQHHIEELRAELSAAACPIERAQIREELRLAQAHLAALITT